MASRQIPDKQYFKIGEVARIAEVKPSVLRFWETEFRSLRPQKTRTNQRLYSRAHVERVLQIRELLYEQGYTITGAKKRLAAGPPEPAGPAREILSEVKVEVEDLLRLLDE